MNAPLILPEHWKYTEMMGSQFGYAYVSVRESEHAVYKAYIVQWAFDWTGGSNIQENYRQKCNKHRIMYKIWGGGNDYMPMPDDIETMQQAVDYLHVLLRLQ